MKPSKGARTFLSAVSEFVRPDGRESVPIAGWKTRAPLCPYRGNLAGCPGARG